MPSALITGAVVSVMATSALATGLASPVEILPAASVKNPAAISRASAVPPVAVAPPKSARA